MPRLSFGSLCDPCRQKLTHSGRLPSEHGPACRILDTVYSMAPQAFYLQISLPVSGLSGLASQLGPVRIEGGRLHVNRTPLRKLHKLSSDSCAEVRAS